MDSQTYRYLKNHPQLLDFVRLHPIWYRLLSRDPALIKQLEKEAKVFYGNTLSQKMNRVNEHVQMAALLMQFVGHMKD
ncbi:MAG TPA: YlbE-like family protein [Bacillota bacterium]